MADRRPMGSLEADILDTLWGADAPMTPAEILADLDVDLAYTTVTTILTRLADKGLVQRYRQGRGFEYAATVTEAELAANRMRSTLAGTSDQLATMSRFVDGLTAKEAAALRAALGGLEP